MGRSCCLWAQDGGGAVAVLLFLPGAAVAKQHFGLQPYLVLVRFFKKYKYGIFC